MVPNDTNGTMAQQDNERILLGRITGLYGVRGWLKVFSNTEPRDNILSYTPWLIRGKGLEGGQWHEITVCQGRLQGKGIIVQLEGYTDRDQARALIGADIAIDRHQLAPLAAGEYYWSDLQELQVVNQQGVTLGRVDHLLETGANDVLVVKGEREHLIPYILDQTIMNIDLEHGIIQVDWDPDF